jgi:hypothetical protein
LALLQGFVYSQLRALEILDPQYQNLGWPKAAHGQDPQDKMFARRCLAQQGAKLIDAKETFAGFLSDIRHNKFPHWVLFDEIFIHGIFEASSRVCADLFDSGLPVSVLRHFVEEQLQRCQRDFPRRLVSNDWNNVFCKKVLKIFLSSLPTGPT